VLLYAIIFFGIYVVVVFTVLHCTPAAADAGHGAEHPSTSPNMLRAMRWAVVAFYVAAILFVVVVALGIPGLFGFCSGGNYLAWMIASFVVGVGILVCFLCCTCGVVCRGDAPHIAANMICCYAEPSMDEEHADEKAVEELFDRRVRQLTDVYQVVRQSDFTEEARDQYHKLCYSLLRLNLSIRVPRLRHALGRVHRCANESEKFSQAAQNEKGQEKGQAEKKELNARQLRQLTGEARLLMRCYTKDRLGTRAERDVTNPSAVAILQHYYEVVQAGLTSPKFKDETLTSLLELQLATADA